MSNVEWGMLAFVVVIVLILSVLFIGHMNEAWVELERPDLGDSYTNIKDVR